MEFRWEDLNWHYDGANRRGAHARGVIHVRKGVLFEIWTFDNHQTYTVLVRYLDGTPVWRFAVGVPKLEALCVAVNWFEKHT